MALGDQRVFLPRESRTCFNDRQGYASRHQQACLVLIEGHEPFHDGYRASHIRTIAAGPHACTDADSQHSLSVACIATSGVLALAQPPAHTSNKRPPGLASTEEAAQVGCASTALSLLTGRRDVWRVQDPLLAPTDHTVPCTGAVGVLHWLQYTWGSAPVVGTVATLLRSGSSRLVNSEKTGHVRAQFASAVVANRLLRYAYASSGQLRYTTPSQRLLTLCQPLPLL